MGRFRYGMSRAEAIEALEPAIANDPILKEFLAREYSPVAQAKLDSTVQGGDDSYVVQLDSPEGVRITLDIFVDGCGNGENLGNVYVPPPVLEAESSSVSDWVEGLTVAVKYPSRIQ